MSLNFVSVQVREIGPNLYEIALPDGEVLATNSPHPEREACALLHSRGVSGTLSTYWAATPYPCLHCDIARVAARHHRGRRKRETACGEAMIGECA